MCNHYQLELEGMQEWARYVGWDAPYSPFDEIQSDLYPRYEAALVRADGGHKIFDRMKWGVPLKMKGKREGTTVTKRVTNVRNLTSRFWTSMLAAPAQRCLVPFTRFAEPKPNAGREECWFRVNDAPVSAFAGIWRKSEEGDVFAFLTCDPNPLVEPIHPKAMPVILHPEDYERWLTTDFEDALSLAVPFPSQLMMLTEAMKTRGKADEPAQLSLLT
jgi:putative SOS response-associated peptidase YedK